MVIVLDITIYLKWVQILEDYFETKDYSDEESFIIATQKLQDYDQYWFRSLRKERALRGRSRLGVDSNPTWIRDSIDIYS